MRLPFLSRRQSTRSAEQPIGYYLNAGGQLEPLLAGKASGLAGLTMHGYGAYSRMPITSTPQGYAYASIASVWAFRCIELRSQACNRVRWFVRQVDSDKEIPNHPLTLALRRSRQKMIRKLEWSKLIWGETFIYPRPNLSGYISDLSWLNNLGMTVDTTPGYVREFQYMPVNGSPMIRFAPEELAYLYTDNPFDDLRGLSRFESVLVDIGIDRDVARTTRAFYLNDTRVGLILLAEQNLQPEQMQRIMDFWKDNLQGPDKAGKPVILPTAIKDVKEIQRAPSIDDVDLRESVRRAICAGFGVPLSLAGAWDDAQYQSAPEQRKSFYEETIIPECEEIRDDLNDVLMPFFDDKRASEIDFDPSGLLALTENAAEKETMLNARLTSGGIMLNEYRGEIELPLLPGGNVFYVPAAITRVPMAEIGLPTPPPQPSQPFAFPGLARPPLLPNGGGNGNGTPVQEQRAALPIHTYDAPRLDAPIVITKQSSADEELDAWERKALNGGAAKALKFACNYLDADAQAFVRNGLADAADKAACRRVFAEAREHLKKNDVADALSATPEDYLTYWQEYDKLREDIGDTWLDTYMQAAYASLGRLDAGISDGDILAALRPLRDGLVETWIGTEAEPGPLMRLLLAGMAAGNQSLIANRPANPEKPIVRIIGLTIDWSLMSTEAQQFARQYAYDLIRGLDATTQQDVRKAIDNWIASGQPLGSLQTAIEAVFKNRARAENIAQTESTRVYYEGAKQRWSQVGVTKAKWQTVRDGLVCPICQPLHNQEADLAVGWTSTKGTVQPPAHPRCRCFAKPVMPKTEVVEEKLDAIAEQTGEPIYEAIDTEKELRAFQREWAAYIKKLDTKQREAVHEYTGEAYEYINASLRKGRKLSEEFQDKVDQLVPQIDSALQQSTVSEDIVTYRGTYMSQLGRLPKDTQRWIGKEFTDDGYVSTTVSTAVAEGFSSEVVMEIRVPKGTNGLYVESITQNDREHEVLLPRGSRFRIVDAKETEFGEFRLVVDIIQ